MAAFLLALCIAAPQVFADTADELLLEITRCADKPDADERLRCFDAVAARAKIVPATPLVTAEGSRSRSPLEWFGLAQPPAPVTRAEQFGERMPRPGELQSITANANEFARTPRGRALFVLDNGQVWRQLDGDDSSVPDPPTSGLKVTIEHGAFGSYNLTMEGRRGLIKVVRVR